MRLIFFIGMSYRAVAGEKHQQRRRKAAYFPFVYQASYDFLLCLYCFTDIYFWQQFEPCLDATEGRSEIFIYYHFP